LTVNGRRKADIQDSINYQLCVQTLCAFAILTPELKGKKSVFTFARIFFCFICSNARKQKTNLKMKKRCGFSEQLCKLFEISRDISVISIRKMVLFKAYSLSVISRRLQEADNDKSGRK
jgi:hypothetical protein